MPYTLTQRFFFDAAHTLRRDIEAQGSRRVHGHTYHCEVELTGERNPATGMIIDLGHVRVAIETVREKLDHHFLDEVEGLGIPTLENLCAFVYSELKPTLPPLSAVRVWREGMGDGCAFHLDGDAHANRSSSALASARGLMKARTTIPASSATGKLGGSLKPKTGVQAEDIADYNRYREQKYGVASVTKRSNLENPTRKTK